MTIRAGEDLCFLSAKRLLRMLRAHELSSRELIEVLFDRIERINPRLNAIVTLASERALKEAADSDYRLHRGQNVRELEGLVVTIKDSFATAGIRSTLGTRIFENNIPDRDAIAVERLRNAGAIIIGKTNVPELAFGFDCENPVFGATNNPWDTARVPGGSSGGEAAALASGLSPLGLGSDYGGSIRVPAHFCGICGLRPTVGTIPFAGGILGNFSPPDVEAMAAAGPMARSVEDLTLAYNILRGPSPSSPNTLPTVAARPEEVDLRQLRCALFCEFEDFAVEPDIKAAAAIAARGLEQRGVVVEQQTPPIKEALKIFNQYRMADGSKALLGWLGDRIQLSRPQLRERLSRPEWEKSASELYRIIIERDRYRAQLASFMERFPIILTVPFRTSAMRHHQPPDRIAGVDYDVFNAALPTNWPSIWVSCAGLPACVVPAGQDRNRLPIGVMLVGRAFDESTVLAAAMAVEQDLGGFQRPRRDEGRAES